MRTTILALIALCAACDSPTAPSSPYEAIEPRTSYQSMYREVWDSCGSKVRTIPVMPFHQIQWFHVPGVSFRVAGHPKDVIGWADDERIYLSELARNRPWAIKHEMLHAQLGGSGHPPIFEQCRLMDWQNP